MTTLAVIRCGETQAELGEDMKWRSSDLDLARGLNDAMGVIELPPYVASEHEYLVNTLAAMVKAKIVFIWKYLAFPDVVY